MERLNVEIGVAGLGKIGLPLAALLTENFKVYGVDISDQRVLQINNREKFFEPHVNEYLEKYHENLTISTDYGILKNCDLVFIITATPSLPSGKFDAQHVCSALKQLHKVNSKCLAIVSSTVNLGDTNKLREIHRRICYNPEFIKQGSIIHNFQNPKFVVIGAYTEKEGEQVADIWRKIHSKPIYIVEPTEAETIKLSLNVSFTLGITFANMIGDLCEKFKADSNKVLDIIYKDRRNYKPGLGFMGPCFPRDVNCFKAACLESNVQSGYRFADLLNKLNGDVVEKCLLQIKSFGKRKIGILGVSYKPEVPYIYESQPLKIAERLLLEGYEVHIYDPLAEENAKRFLHEQSHIQHNMCVFDFCSSLSECIEKSEVIFIGTANHSSVKLEKPIIDPWK